MVLCAEQRDPAGEALLAQGHRELDAGLAGTDDEDVGIPAGRVAEPVSGLAMGLMTGALEGVGAGGDSRLDRSCSAFETDGLGRWETSGLAT
jgi:hypothetical protein